MPELLRRAYRDQLITWIGKPCHFRLLYKISRDGCSPQTFHQKCDSQGATVTVLYNTNNTIYGGYLSQSWNSSGLYINDIKTFLFRLQHNGSSSPLKFPIKDESKAGFCSNSCGPTFGGGYDFCTFSGTITNSGNEFSLNGSVNKIGMSYNLNGQNVNSITNNNLKVTDLEVYRVVDNMDCYLKDRDRLQLSSWLGKECHFKLLYRISRDGGSPQTFHYLCDNKGPTVTIFYNTDNNVYGGYLSESWRSTGGWITDISSFLFQFYSNSKWKPNKIPLKIQDENVFFCESYGPTFDNLPSFEGNIEKTSNRFEMRTKDLFSGSYYITGRENAQSIANGHNNLTDLEVYLVKDGPAEPWREPPIWESETLDSLKEFIRSFQPKEELNVPEVNILLVGQVGAGKSSVVNTINSIWKGEISTRSWAGSSEHSLTTSFTKFRISDPSTGTYLKFRLCDMRGLEETMDVKLEDIAFLLDGNLPNKYKFNPVARATKDTPGFIKEPTMKDMIHTVVFVIDGSNVEVMPDGIIKKLKDIKEMLIERDVPLLVLVTKIDKVCSDVDKDVEEVFFSNAVKKTVDKVSDVIAIPRSHVLPVKNYEKERTLQNNISILAMEALKQALLFCQDFLENQS